MKSEVFDTDIDGLESVLVRIRNEIAKAKKTMRSCDPTTKRNAKSLLFRLRCNEADIEQRIRYMSL